MKCIVVTFTGHPLYWEPPRSAHFPGNNSTCNPQQNLNINKFHLMRCKLHGPPLSCKIQVIHVWYGNSDMCVYVYVRMCTYTCTHTYAWFLPLVWWLDQMVAFLCEEKGKCSSLSMKEVWSLHLTLILYWGIVNWFYITGMLVACKKCMQWGYAVTCFYHASYCYCTSTVLYVWTSHVA